MHLVSGSSQSWRVREKTGKESGRARDSETSPFNTIWKMMSQSMDNFGRATIKRRDVTVVARLSRSAVKLLD